MSEANDSATTAAIHRFRPRFEGGPDPGQRAVPIVSFSRGELGAILNVYGRRVADGEWRDYAIDFAADRAVFSIYRRASEMPLYRIEKRPANARKQGAYSIVASTGVVLKRGGDLLRVLGVFERRPHLVLV